jgi:hypothetical protein
VNDDFASRLRIERMKFAVLTNGSIAALAAGAIYWSVLCILGFSVSTAAWCGIAFIASGLIFPLALVLQKPTNSNMMVKNHPLSNAGFAAMINIILAWPIIIAALHTDPALVPLALAIGLSLHLSVNGWSYAIKTYMVHPLIRAAVVTALWYAFPDDRFTVIPLAVALIYLCTIPFVVWEVAAARKALKVEGEGIGTRLDVQQG